MKIIENNGLTILLPESSDFVLYNVRHNSYHDKVYLGKADSVNNYREINKELQPGYQKDLNKIISNQEQAIAELSNKLEQLMAQVNQGPKDI